MKNEKNEENTENTENTENAKSPGRKASPLTVALFAIAAILVGVIVFCAVKVGVDLAERAKARTTYSSPELEAIGSLLEGGEEDLIPSWTREPVGDPSDGSDAPDTTDAPDVTDGYIDDDMPEDPPEEVYSERFTAIRNDILALKEKYPDVIGYIMIEELGIKYPLVQRLSDKDQTYYLMRTYDGYINRAGAIFMDIRCSDFLYDNINSVIYGHNMKDGQMFGRLYVLLNYKERFERAEIVIATLDGIYTYKVFSGYRTTTEYYYIDTDFSSDAEYLAFLEDIKKKSVIKSDMELSVSDRIITLSTCTNGDENGRFAVHGVLTEISH